jgi:hypothetical protein
VAAKAAPAASGVPAAKATRPVAALGKDMPSEKAARLEAIRAAKRAAGSVAGEQAAKQVLGITPDEPGAAPAEEAAVSPTAPPATAAAAPPAATGKSMSPEKLARLEAIRAAKRGEG